MSNCDSEVDNSLNPDNSTSSDECFTVSQESLSTDVECVPPHKESQQLKEKDSTECVEEDKQNASTSVPIIKIDKGHDAARYFDGESRSSSGDSSKTSSHPSSVDLSCVITNKMDESGNVDYVDVEFDRTIDENHVGKLMQKLSHNHYTAVSCEGDSILSKCGVLFEMDYTCKILTNYNGILCTNYPARIFIPVEAKREIASSESVEMDFDLEEYNRQVKSSVCSRIRTRFVVPVILFDNKFICRAGTITVRKSAAYETARQKEAPQSVDASSSAVMQAPRRLVNAVAEIASRGMKAASHLLKPDSMEKLKTIDAEIIKDLKIKHVCDLMIEDRKTFKKSIKISSSEKINKDIYNDCLIEQMPYPGCKLFKNYHEANRKPEGILFDWKRRDVNAELLFSEDPNSIFPHINWTNYKEWDLVDLTKNYLKMLLFYLARDRDGLLVHCVSGWDRTPLFISILRVSLWADGVIHQSLDYREMAYLTLAYDWYLFGHNLPERLIKREEIMHFCFKFLAYIVSDEFSVTRIFHELPLEQKKDRVFPQYKPNRRQVLDVLSKYVLVNYNEHITRKL